MRTGSGGVRSFYGRQRERRPRWRTFDDAPTGRMSMARRGLPTGRWAGTSHTESDLMPLIVLAAVAAAFLASLIAIAVATLAEPGGLTPRATETW